MTPGVAFEGYEVIRKLGGGNMGVVYLAVRQDTGQQVAIKVVSGGHSQDEQEKIAIERDGATLQQRIARTDPLHIVAVNRLLYRNGDLIVEMEYVSGENLGEVIRNGKALPPDRAARIALELARMLDNLDRIQPRVVHGDLKPGNVLVKGDCAVKVVDFGIAKQLSHGRGTFNQFQSVPYSSPERLRTGDVDELSDLWAVAVMLYEMTAGCHPFSAPMNMLRMRVLDGRGPNPLPEGCPTALGPIIAKALAASPEERYPSASALAGDLERYLNGQPIEARAPDPNATVRTARPTPVKAAVAPSLGKQWLQVFNRYRGDVRLIAVGVVLFVLIFLGHNQYVVGRSGAEIRQALLSGQLTLNEAWEEFSELRKSAWVPFLLYGVTDTLETKLFDEGSEPVIDFRQDLPTASLADWQRAEEDLLRFVQLEPRNKIARGRELICEGQIARLRSRSLVRGHVYSNSKLLNQAIAHFQQAAELMPDSPDPYLALAPVYLYYQQDYDRGMAMQEAAVKRGHAAGKRETAQIADTKKANARHDLALAQQLDDDPERKKEHLRNAISAFDSAIVYYDQIDGFAGSSQGLKDAQQGKQQAQRMLDEMP
jgi:tetratricopeptide (TPR) repeat protein